MKKLIIMFLVLVMVGSNLGVYAEDVNKMPPDEETLAKMRENEAKQIPIQEIASMSEQELRRLHLAPLNEPRSTAATEYTVPTKAVMQSTTYYCGPAATLMALYTAGAYGQISGSTDSAKQDTLAAQLGTTTGTATVCIPDVMNSYTSRSRAWTSALWTTYNTFWNVLYFSKSNFSYGDAVIFCLDSQFLGYYEGYACVHFVTGTGLYLDNGSLADYGSILMRLQDPHYDLDYYGTHTVPAEQLRKAIEDFHNNHNFVY